ncbi:hypothetical protein ACPW6H_005558, partial [Pseudomonas aeruginosa]
MSQLNKESVEQAGGDERVIGWRERILAAHPNSDPGFWPDALLVEHMAAEIADLRAALAQPSQAQAEQAEGAHVPDEVFAGVFAEWWEEEGQYCRAGGGDYERTFAFQAWRHLYPLLLQARAALAQPSPVRSSLLINGYQLRAALDFIAPDGTAEQLKSEACIEWRQQDADFLEAGLYAFCAEYPEEGGVLLDEEPTTAQPSPLQSEQAEAERPEVAEVAFVLRNIGAMDAEDIDGDNVDLRFEDAEGRDTGCDVSIVEYAEKAADLFEQHDRIVGALRADRDSWAEQAEQRLADWDEMRKERGAALARVAELERQEPVALANRGLHAFWVKWTEAAAGLYGPGIKLYAAPVAQAQQLHDLDKQCRDDVARALGLRPNQERGFAWSYLLASIKSCVKASGD